MFTEKVVPVIWLMIAAVIIGGSIGLSIRADAQPIDPDQFTWTQGQSICAVWSAGGVTVENLKSIGRQLDSFGFTSSQKASIVVDSTELWCPKHMPALSAVAFVEQQRNLGHIA